MCIRDSLPIWAWHDAGDPVVPVLLTRKMVDAARGAGAEVRYDAVSYTHLRAHETVLDLVCRLLLEKKTRNKKKNKTHKKKKIQQDTYTQRNACTLGRLTQHYI